MMLLSRGKPPSPRSEHAATSFAERYLLIFGGGSHSTCFSDLHLLDTQTVRIDSFPKAAMLSFWVSKSITWLLQMEWSRPKQQGVTPVPRAGHAGVTIGEYWFLTGGGNSRKGKVEIFDSFITSRFMSYHSNMPSFEHHSFSMV